VYNIIDGLREQPQKMVVKMDPLTRNRSTNRSFDISLADDSAHIRNLETSVIVSDDAIRTDKESHAKLAILSARRRAPILRQAPTRKGRLTAGCPQYF
jgi:hypothetical protein